MSEKKGEEKSSGGGWPGIFPIVRRFFYGAMTPKLSHYGASDTPSGSEAYESMDKNYRWFRQCELVRKCVTTNALFATTAGFETELQAPGDVTPEEAEARIKKYSYVKEFIDSLNKKFNFDNVIFRSQIKRSIYGLAGWEIVLEKANGPPAKLIIVQSDKLKPLVGKEWDLEGYKYTGIGTPYTPDEILYFPNLVLEADLIGLSDIEPIRGKAQARYNLIVEDFGEIVRTTWAPYVLLESDTSGLTPTDADTFLDTLKLAARSGKSLAFNRAVEATVVDMTPDITGLVKLLEKLEEAIQRPWGTPKFLLGKPIENRATAYAELEAYVQGPIANIQLFFKRAIEAQWYDRWTRWILKDHGVAVPEGEDLPIEVKHVWNPIRVTDVYEMAKAVAQLYGAGGMGILGDREEIAFEMMGWNKDILVKEEEQSE